MNIKIKKLNSSAKIPTYAKPGDGALDLTAVSREYDAWKDIWWYGTGLAIEIPEGYVGLIFTRSGIFRTNMSLSNHVGVIDSGFRGEVRFAFRTVHGGSVVEIYDVGDRIGQLIIMPYPQVQLVESDILSTSERTDRGHGSSGK